MPNLKNIYLEDNIKALSFERYNHFYTYYNAFTLSSPQMRGNIVEAMTGHGVALKHLEKGINKDKILTDWENLKFGIFAELEGFSLLSKAVEALITAKDGEPYKPNLDDPTKYYCPFYPFEALSIAKVASDKIREQISFHFPEKGRGVLSLEERLYLGYDAKLVNQINLNDLEAIKALDLEALISERYVFGYNLKDLPFVNPNYTNSVMNNKGELLEVFLYIAKSLNVPLSTARKESVFDVLATLNQKKE